MKSRAWSVMMSLLLLAGFRTAGANGAEVLPVGTVLNVRTSQPIVVYSSHVGMKFRAIVEDPVMDVRGHVVVRDWHRIQPDRHATFAAAYREVARGTRQGHKQKARPTGRAFSRRLQA